MTQREQTLKWLEDNGVEYQLYDHPAVYTIDEMRAVDFPEMDKVLKNLFLRDAKGRRHFLVCVTQDSTIDLKALGESLGTRLGFASPERLKQWLNLTPGAVTPLGVMYDISASVEVYISSEVNKMGKVVVHPCDNTASVVLKLEDLLRILRDNGNSVGVIDMQG